jgi:hypothetical protein
MPLAVSRAILLKASSELMVMPRSLESVMPLARRSAPESGGVVSWQAVNAKQAAPTNAGAR